MHLFLMQICQIKKNTMKKGIFLFILLSYSLFFTSCEKEETNDPCVPSNLAIANNSSKQMDEATLDQLLAMINERAQNNTCVASDAWSIIAIGTKACGGPLSYIPYNSKIDSTCFFGIVNYYAEQMSLFNKKHNIISDCSVVPMPKGVKCENGKPVVFY